MRFNLKTRESEGIPIGHLHHFFINGEMSAENEEILALIKALKYAGEGDVIHIHINSEGGDVYVAMQLINSIKSCKGSVVTEADGQVASAASLLFFSGHYLNVGEFSSFLLHNGNMYVGGKHNDVLLTADKLKNLVSDLFHSVYFPYFSREEIDGILSGRDIHLSSQQVVSRLRKVVNNNNKDNIVDSDPATKRPNKRAKGSARSSK